MGNQVGMPGATLPAISGVFANEPIEDLSEGIRSALATISLKASVFGIRYRKQRYELPAESQRRIEVIILKGAKTTSKAFWLNGYVQGSDSSPDCWSSNGKVPDQQVPNPVKPSCSVCPNDVFITQQNGMKSKPCGDGKRIAVVPAADIENDGFGGPMLLRVPAGSLGGLEMYGKHLKTLGAPFYAFTTIISMIPGEVTKLMFEPGRPLTDEEAVMVVEHRNDERTARIVNEELTEDEPTEEASAGGMTPEQVRQPAPAPAAARPTVAPRAAGATATPRVNPPQQAPMATATVAGGFAATSKPAPVQAATPIGEALSRPATPPPSTRTVQVPLEQVEASETQNVDDLFETLMK